MARPKRAGLDYFPLDTDFFNDDKIQLIEAEFGPKGSYVAIRLLCKIYDNGWFYRWGGDECLLLTKQMGAGFVPNTVDEIVRGLVRRSFFHKGVFDSFHALTSAGIQRRYMSVVKQMGRNLADFVQETEMWIVPTTKINGNFYNLGINGDNLGINGDNLGKECTKENKENETKKNGGTRTREEQVNIFLKKIGDWKGSPLTLEFATQLMQDDMTLTVIAQQAGLPSVEAVEDQLTRFMGWLLVTRRTHTDYGGFVQTFITHIKFEQKERSYDGTKTTTDRARDRRGEVDISLNRPEDYAQDI